jgi:hypothetical protein
VVYRRLFTRLRKDRVFDAGFSDEQLFEQTDLQITAMAWLTQQARFAQLCGRGEDRLRSLDSETLLLRKSEAIAGLGKHFGLNLDVDALLASPIFSLHSKQPSRSYDGAQRRREIDAARAAHGEEIGLVTQWAEGVARQAGIKLKLPCPLLAPLMSAA